MKNKKPVLLIVDDDKTICEELSSFLMEVGYKVFCANSKKDAQSSLKSKKIDMALLDIKLPDGSGLDLIGDIKESNKDAYTIVITASGSLSSAVEAFRNKVYDYILKPFDFDDLLNLIEEAFEEKDKKLKEREKVAILEKFQEAAVDRELKMIELKEKIGDLKKGKCE